MKKILSVFLAALMLTLCGCGDKTDTDTDSPVPEQPTDTTEPAEPVFAEYTEEDFTPIKMNLNITDDPPPFEIHSADLSGLDFGERLSPCKAEDVREEYGRYQSFSDPERQAEYDAEMEHLYNTPSKGSIVNTAYLDGKFYFSVNFDDLCGRHDSSVFSFDPETGETKELAARTGIEYSAGFDNFISCSGRLIFTGRDEDIYTIHDLDPISGEVSELFTVDEDVYWVQPSPNGLWLCTDNTSGDRPTNILEYNVEAGGRVSNIGEEDFSAGYGIFGLLTCGGQPAEATDSMDTTIPLSVETAFYSLDTELKKCMSVYLWEDKVSVMADLSDYYYLNDRRLYTYDFERMERTELNMNGFSEALNMAGDGFVNTVQLINTNGISETAYYIAPQLGAAFRLFRSDWIKYTASGGIYCFLTSKLEKTESNYVPEKIYWFEVQE